MNNEYAALIIGATGGIGQAIAKSLHQTGKPVILVGRRLDALNTLAQELRSSGTASVYEVMCDISDDTSRQSLLSAVTDLSVKVDVMINNAGINHFGLFAQQSDEAVAAQLQVNAIYPLLLIKTFLPYFESLAADIQIINVGSTFGTIAYPGFAAYSASKFALRGATEALMREYADSNIRFRYFSPRATQTSLNSAAVVQMNQELKVAMDSPETVANELLAFLNNGKPVQYLGWPEKLFVKINQLLPRMVSSELKKSLPVIRKYALLKD